MGVFSGLTALGKIAGVVKSIINWLHDRKVFQAGRDRERAESNQRVNDDVRKANEAVISLNNPDKRKRVRDKFRRPSDE